MSGPLLGQVLAVLSAASFAFANYFISRTTRSGGDKGVMFSVLVTVGISAVLWIMLEGAAIARPASASDWVALGWFAVAGVLAMVFGRTLVFESIRRLGVTRSAALKRLNPFFSVILAALLLGEAVGGLDLVGMAAIALAFGLLIRESFRARGQLNVTAPAPVAYLFGIFGALAYALTYIARKAGLDLLPAPAFGTFFSAVAGFAAFVVLAAVSERQRGHFRSMFRHLDRWIVAAAVMVSLGQILLFAALAYETVSVVVMVASMEIFISIFLSVVVFRTEPVPGIAIALAAVLATSGVVLVAVG